MARPKDKAPIRKQEILEHFYKVLRDEGLERASLAKIASSMGVHPSLLIHYFSSKEQMTLALVDYIAELYSESYIGWIQEIADPNKRLDAILDMLFGRDWMEHVDQSVFHACHYLGFHNDEIKRRFKAIYGAFREPLKEEFKNLMEHGLIREMDAGLLADTVIAMTEGLDFYGTVIGTGGRFRGIGEELKSAALSLMTAGASRSGSGMGVK